MKFNIFSKKESPLNLSGLPPRAIKPKSHEEHKREVLDLIKSVTHLIAIRLAKEIIINNTMEAGSIMQGLAGDSNFTEKEIKNIITEFTIENDIWQDISSNRVLMEILIGLIERGKGSPKELEEFILQHEGLGNTFRENLKKEILKKRNKVIKEDERLAKEGKIT